MSKRRKSSGNNPATLAKISSKIEFLDKNMDKINLALWGKNGRGGIVKDVQEIKSATSTIKSIAVPIIIAVVSAVITAGVLNSL